MSNPAVERPLSRLRTLARGAATTLGRWALGEPVAVVPKRVANQLDTLQRRERLRNAERTGDLAYLERELARVQPTAEELRRSAVHNTPFEDWPDEDVDALLGPAVGVSSPTGTSFVNPADAAESRRIRVWIRPSSRQPSGTTSGSSGR